MNWKEKQTVPAAEYFVLCFKENESFVAFSFFFSFLSSRRSIFLAGHNTGDKLSGL